MKKFRTLYGYLRPYRRRLLLAFAGTAAFTVFSLLPPLLMRRLIDKVLRPHRWAALPVTVLLILLVPFTSALVRYANTHVIMLAARRFVAGIRLRMYQRILHLSMRYHSEHPPGMLVGRLMDDVNMLQRLLTGDTVQIAVDVIVFGFAMTVLFLLSWKLAFILSATLVLYVAAYRVFSARIRGASHQYREVYDQITGRLQETLAGVRQVRIFNREDTESALFLQRTARSLEHQFATNMSSVGLANACSAIAGYGSTFIAALGGYFILKGEISYGDLFAIDSYAWMAVNPVIRLTNVAAQLSETFVSLGRIVEVLEAPADIQSAPHAPRLRRGAGAVSFRGVHFSYIPERPLFQGLSLEIPPGRTIALAGHTGCGKTTLTSLLMRYWDVQQGAILVDGADIRSVDLRSLRSRFGVVLQQPVLFEGTLAENIAYGRPDVSRKRIEEAARSAEIYDMAMELPGGFDTLIGTAGVKLSLGEKQRVSIARAVIRDPMILVMDEATSSLDSESEALIQKALRNVLKGRTSFVIAHRLSTIVSADLIVVMDEGRIAETGTHRELLARGDSLYRSFCMQLRHATDEEDEA
jgi:subfamily B ATP-binding cassette protein MsbA